MNVGWKDRRILLTGASSGLGRAVAVALGRRGARLVLVARSRQGLAETAALALAAGAGEVHVLRGDLAKSSCRALPGRAAALLGGLDVLINNAGVHALAALATVPESLVREALQVNLFGPLRMLQGALPHLRASRGLVVNVGSTLAWRSIPLGGIYSASKAAAARLHESLRDEEARHGVRVLQFDPGVILTPLRSNALKHGAPVEQDSGKLPFPRGAEATAEELLRAMELGRSRDISAAWPVRVWCRVLAPWFGGFLDGRMALKDGSGIDPEVKA